MAQNFSELIYKSTDPSVGVASGVADRLLGIKPDGLAVVVDIGGDNTVVTRADLRPVASTPVADDTVAYSKKGADDTFFVKTNVEVQSSASVAADDKVYSCKAVRDLIEQTTDGSKWEAIASSSPAAIRPKSNKAVVIGSAGSTSSLTVNGDSTLNGGATVSGATALKGDTTIGTETDAAYLSIYGGMTVSDNVRIGTFENRKALLVGQITFMYEGGTIVHPSRTLSYDSTNGFVFNDKCTATAFYESSDAALKENVVPVSAEAKEKAAGIKFVEFDWKSGGGHSYGVIAQDVEEVMPEIVLDSSAKRVNYNALLCAKVAALEDEVKLLKDELKQLKSIIQNGDNDNIG